MRTLAQTVQLRFDLRPDGQRRLGPVDLDDQPLAGAEGRGLLGQGGDQPLLGQGARLELEDEGAQLGQRAPGQADRPLNQSRQALHAAWPLHSPEGASPAVIRPPGGEGARGWPA
jgi:hypothetical protein